MAAPAALALDGVDTVVLFTVVLVVVIVLGVAVAGVFDIEFWAFSVFLL